MTSLTEVILYIAQAPLPLDCVVVNVAAWEQLRDECRYMCEENDEPFSTNPHFYAPNFLVMGIPVIAAGTA